MVIETGRGECPGRAQRVAATSQSIMRGAACARQHQEGIGRWGPEIAQTVWHERVGGETIVPPSGLGLGCPAEVGMLPTHCRACRRARRPTLSPTRQARFSELSGGASLFRAVLQALVT